jgi:hypothetical protein
MNQGLRIKLIKQIVADINSNHKHPILLLGGIDSQWERGNGSIKRDNSSIASLSLNIKDSGFLVGCDGVKVGINSYLEENLTLNNSNTQNIRYQCPDAKIKEIIERYAQLKV